MLFAGLVIRWRVSVKIRLVASAALFCASFSLLRHMAMKAPHPQARSAAEEEPEQSGGEDDGTAAIGYGKL